MGVSSEARQLLLKFRGDLSEIKDHFKGVEGLYKQTNATLTSERNKARAEVRSSFDEVKKLASQQNTVQISLIKARQKASEAETKYEKANAAAQLKRLITKSNEIKLQQQLIALKEKQNQLDNPAKAPSGIANLLKSFSGAATGGGLLNTIVAGAAGGGAFLVLSQLAEKAGELVKTFAEMPFKAGELAESLEKAATRAGVTTKEFQQLRLAAAETGMSEQTMGRAVMMMHLQLTRSGASLSKAELELKRFNVSIRDGQHQVVSANEIIKRMATLFHGDDLSVATKVKLAADVFSRRIGSQMIPLLNQGSEAVQELYDRSDKYSILVNEDLIEAQHKWNVETASLKMQWDQMIVMMGSGALPVLIKVAKLINDIVEGMNQSNGVNAPKQFADNIDAWARARGMMTGKNQKKVNIEETQSGMDQIVPIETQRKIYEGTYGKDKASKLHYGKKNTWKDIFQDLQQDQQPVNSLIDQFTIAFPKALEESKKGAGGLDKRLQDNSKSVTKLNDITIKYKETLAQLKEKQTEAGITNKQFDLKTKYDQGLISQKDFVEQSKQLDKEQHESKLSYIKTYADLEKDKIRVAAEQQKTQLGGEVPGEGEDTNAFAAEQQEKITLINQQTAEKLKIIDVQTNEKRLAENEKFHKENQQLDINYINSVRKARETNLKEELKYLEENLNEQKTLLDFQLNQGITSYDNYKDQREKQITEEVNLSLESARLEYENGIKTEEALAQYNAKQREARAKGEKELTDLLRGEMSARVAASQRRYSGFSGLNKSKLSASELIPGAGGVDQANEARQGIMLAAQQYKNEQEDLLRKTVPLSEEWFKILGNISSATEEIKKMNNELRQSQNILSNSGALLGMLGTLLGGFGVTRGGVGNIGAAGNLLGQLGARESKGKGNVFTDASDVLNKGTFKDKDGNLDITTGFQKLTKGLEGAIKAVSSFAEILGSSKGHIGDILGGGLSGAGIGKDIGSMFSKFGKMAGPIGEIAGAAFGGILSGIVGRKNNQTQDYINSVNRQMQDLSASISNGTTGLQSGIAQMEALRQGVIGQEGSSKKKQKAALEQEAAGIQQQIIALQQQVTAMFVDLGNQLKVLNAPTQFQSLLGSLNDIFMQYKKFKEAAGNATQLAQANEYLSASLRNFADTEGTALNQAEQQAIQDALQLNQLLTQRYELMTNEAQSEYDIMTQGVLINQRTAAQTKMFQIQQDRNQYNLQLDQLNQQISLTKYKVDSESKIFNLATTRIALEAQLLALQESQTDKDMLRIKALQQVVELLASGQSISTIDQLLNRLGLSNDAATNVTTGPSTSSITNMLNKVRNSQAASGWGNTTSYIHT
jgi:hypothetical protein